MATHPDHPGAPSEIELNRLRWQCRRGLLELDLALEKFLARHAASLSREELAQLNELLVMGDNELWDFVSGRADFSIPGADVLVGKLRENWN